MLFLLQFRFCFVLVECFGWQYLPAQNLLPWECWYFLSAFAFLRKWKFWGWLECTVRYRVSSTQTVVASTSWRPCYETNFLTCFINKLVQNKSLPLDFGFVRARGAGSPWAYWRAPPNSPNKIYIAKFGPLNWAFSAWKWYERVFSGYVFQPITMLNCCTTCMSWEKGSYDILEV